METYSEKMLKALAAEELAEAQLNFTEALQKACKTKDCSERKSCDGAEHGGADCNGNTQK